MVITVHQIPELLWTLEGDAERMLPATEDTLGDDSEVRARLRGRTAAVTAAEIFLEPFVPGILLCDFAMMVEEGNWEKFTK